MHLVPGPVIEAMIKVVVGFVDAVDVVMAAAPQSLDLPFLGPMLHL